MRSFSTGLPNVTTGQLPSGINANKIGDGSVSNAELESLDGVTGDIQPQLDAAQTGIQYQDEGSNLGTSGTASTVNFVGAGITATRATNTITVTVSGGITNSAGNNVVMKSNGTNAVASQITDDGTTVTIPVTLNVGYLGVLNNLYLGTQGGAFPILDGGVGSNLVRTRSGADASSPAWYINLAGNLRVATDVPNATATMANISALTANLLAGRTYSGRLVLFVSDSVAADGVKVDFDGGTATATDFRAHGTIFDTALQLSTQTTAIATDFSVAVITGNSMVEIYFTITVNAAGTFIPRFAQAAHTTGTATAFRGSYMILHDMP